MKKSIKVKTIGGENTHFMNVWTKQNLEVNYRDKIFWWEIVFIFPLMCLRFFSKEIRQRQHYFKEV